jgi:transcription elongation GreA/GreB family factor
MTYLVGSIEERHEKYDVLSTNSPLGTAILGKGPGSTVTYQGPKREMSVTIVAVRVPD